MSNQRQRFYHRFIRAEDLPELEAASAFLFAFDPKDLSLKDIINSDRWFCLAAVTSNGSGSERIVGFVAAALGSIKEFPQEAQFLEAALLKSTEPAAAAAAAAVASLASSTAATQATASDSSSNEANTREAEHGSSSSNSSSSSDALALEVVLLGVVPEFRRRGVASRLIKQVKTHATTRGASQLFLHVQTSNAPARQLYQKLGFKAAAVLPGYYSEQLAQRGQLGRQQQQDPMMAAAAAAVNGSSSSGDDELPTEFSGSDAELLVMNLDVAAAAAAVQYSDGASTSSSSSEALTGPDSSSARFIPDSDNAVAAAAAAASGSSKAVHRQKLQQLYIEQEIERISSSSATHTSSPAGSSSSNNAAAAAATEAVTAAAAAAARLLLGPAIGLLGLAPKGRNNTATTGPRGELVQVGDEWMVQVRTGRDVVLYDPDELPSDVILTDRDKAVLQRQRQQQLAAVQQQQQQGTTDAQSAAHSRSYDGTVDERSSHGDDDDDDDDDDGDGDDKEDDSHHSGSSSSSNHTDTAQQQQQQPAAVGSVPGFNQQQLHNKCLTQWPQQQPTWLPQSWPAQQLWKQHRVWQQQQQQQQIRRYTPIVDYAFPQHAPGIPPSLMPHGAVHNSSGISRSRCMKCNSSLLSNRPGAGLHAHVVAKLRLAIG